MERRQVVGSLFTGNSPVSQRLKATPWEQTALGAVEAWPCSLKSTLGILLNSQCPMFCVWGSDRILFYNDAGAASFEQSGAGIAVGQPLLPVVPPKTAVKGSLKRILASVEQVFTTGQPLQQASPSSHNGQAATKCYTWSYSPIWDETGAVSGVFACGSAVVKEPLPLDRVAVDLPSTIPQWQRLANALPVLLAYTDRDRRYQFVNETYTDWFGIKSEEVIGKRIEEVIGKKAYATIKPDIDAVLSGQELSSEREVYFKRVGWRHVQRVFVPDIAEDGEVKGYYALVTDVTEQRRTEDFLHQREEELQLITDTVPVLIAFVDQEQRYRFNNQTYEAWFGLSPQSLKGRYIRDVVGDKGYQVVRPYVERALAGEAVTFEHEIPFQTGGARYVEATYIPRFDRQRAVRGFVALVSDVSDRKRAERARNQVEAALRESEARFRRIADCSPIMIWMSAPDGAGTWFNQQWCEFTGQTLAEAMGDGWLAALHPEDAAMIHETCTQAHRNREAVRLEYRLRQQNGDYRWVLDNAIPRFDENGTYLGYIGSIIDIDDRKQAEAERERLLLELAAERAQFEAVLRQMPEGVLIADAASDQLVLANEQTRRILRYDYELGETLPGYQPLEPFEARRVTGDTYTADEYPLARSLRAGEVVTHEEMHLHFADGSQVVIDVNSSPVFNHRGQITSAIAVFQDVTERRQAEVALRQSEERARLAIKVGRLGTWHYHLQSDQVSLDERMREIWGEAPDGSALTLAQVINRIHPSDRKRVRGAVLAAFAPTSSGTYETDYRIMWDDGTIRWISANGQTKFEGEGEARHAVEFSGTVLDITDRKRAEIALQEQEQRYRYIFEAVNVPIWEEDFTQVKAALDQLKAEGVQDLRAYFEAHPEFVETAIDLVHVKDVNQAALRLYEAEDKGQLLTSLAATLVEESLTAFTEELVAIAAEDRFFTTETIVQTLHGKHLQVLINIVFPEDGTYDRVLVSLLDVTDLKESEAARRYSEERLRIALQHAPVTVFNQDRELRYTWIYKPTLHQPEEVLGRRDRDFLPPDDAAMITAIKQRVLDTGIGMHGEVKVTRDGIDHYFDLTVEPLHHSDGTIIGITGSSINISASKRTALKLQESEERLRLAMEGAQMATWDVDLQTGVAIWSERHFEMLGYPPNPDGEASEAMWNHCIHPADRERVFAEWQLARTEHRFYRAEYRVIRADNGEISWLEGLGNFRYDEQGEAVRSIGVLFDISDRKRDEMQRQQTELALQEQRNILEAILRQAADAIIVSDAEGQLIFVNREARRLAQLDPEGTNLDIDFWDWGIAHDKDGNIIPVEDYCMKKALRGEASSAFESRMVRADGSYYDILISAAPLWNDQQEIVGAVGNFMDISDRKRAEEALRESEVRFRTLADTAPMLVWMSGPDKLCNYFNQSWLQFTGRTAAQEMGNGWVAGVHPDDRDRCLETYSTAFDAQQAFEMEYRLRRHDGEYRWIFDVGVPRFTAEGEFLGYIGSCFDLHDRKQAEAALQESEERFRNLADNISQFAWMTDPSGWIFWYNQRWFDYTGTTLEEMAGWGWRAIHHPDHVDRVVEHFSRCLQTGEPWEDIFPLRSKDGTYRWFLSRALPIRDEHGQILRWFGTNTDITERKQVEETLAQREAELRLVTNAVPALISFVDAEGRYRFNNRRYEDWFGQPPEATYGKHLREVLGESAYEGIRPYVEQVLAGQEVNYESQIPYREGGVRYISATYVPRFNAKGKVAGFVALVSDISDRKRGEAERQQAEAALRQSEERLRLAQQAAGAGLWDWQMDSDQVTWSPEYYHLYGLAHTVTPSYENWIGSIAEVDQDRVSQAAHEAVKHCQNLNVEFRIEHPFKGQRWLAAIGQTFYGEDGQPIRMTGIALDITEQKRFEEALIKSEALAKTRAEELTAIMETTPAAIWIAHDPECHNITGNQTAYELMRMEPGSITTATAADGTNPLHFTILSNGAAIAPDDLPMQKAARTREAVTGELEFIFNDGTVCYIYGKAVPLYGRNDEVRGVIGGFVDITALKQSEQERERLLQRERQAREEAENASRIKDEFLAILSHELRSPLNPILGWTALLRQGRLNAERTATALETIERNAKLQIQLIDDLLDVSRIIRGKLSLKMAPTQLENTIRAAIETVRLAAEAKGIPIETQFAPLAGTVLGDSARLQQVVWNLLSNAVKFTPEGGQVTISLSMADQPLTPPTAGANSSTQYAQIQVTDTGKGIPASFLPHVFEYFRQADSTTTRSFGGLGLGLAIVRYLVELHGGTVQAASPGEEQGATFTVWLPLRPKQLPSVPAFQAEESPTAPATQRLRGREILVVDDDADTRQFIAFALEEQGAQVTDTDSAQAALQALEATPFDLIISDIGMPAMDGFMLMRQLRASAANQGRHVPAIALTAYAADGDRDRALAAGFQRHIAKPVEFEQLVEAIMELI